VAKIFSRLIGLETEYAIRFRPADSSAPRMSRYRIYEAVIASLKQRVLTVRAKHFKEGVFLANGGAVWFEAERPAAGGGLIEGATPECMTPRQLIAHQRAQDRLLAEACRTDELNGEAYLIKNDRDARDHVYGAQENYEANLASGLMLWIWRIGLVLLFPLALITWVGIAACLLATLVYFLLLWLLYILLRRLVSNPLRLAETLFGKDLAEGVRSPDWLESLLQIVARLVTAPCALGFDALIRTTVFRDVREQLLPFLVTRPVIAGAGLVDRQGNYQLSDKGPAINSVLGFGGFWGNRPIFNVGHFFKAIYARVWFSPREYGRLFSSRQRLQIGVGDSNMCEVAEYLRVGTTLLVLDMIEAGGLRVVPYMSLPVEALHAACMDLSLRKPVCHVDGAPASPLQVQRHYYEACCDFVARLDDAPQEVRFLLNLWRDVLDGLEYFAETGEIRMALVGSLDWVTKKYLIEQAGQDADWQQRKKIDIRYHELSSAGYFELLKRAGVTATLIDEDSIDRASRLPPPGTPATVRGHYIREFSAGDETMTASWTNVIFGSGWNARVIPLVAGGRRRTRGRKGPRSPRSSGSH
jgi:proteasome accessory factor A